MEKEADNKERNQLNVGILHDDAKDIIHKWIDNKIETIGGVSPLEVTAFGSIFQNVAKEIADSILQQERNKQVQSALSGIAKAIRDKEEGKEQQEAQA